MPLPGFFYQKVLPKSLILERKIENKNDDGKIDNVGGKLELRDLLAVKILSIKSCTMYLLSLIPGLKIFFKSYLTVSHTRRFCDVSQLLV